MSKSAAVRILIVIATQLGQLGAVPAAAATQPPLPLLALVEAAPDLVQDPNAVAAPLAATPVMLPPVLSFGNTTLVGQTNGQTAILNNAGDAPFTIDGFATTDSRFEIYFPWSLPYDIGYGTVATATAGPAGYPFCANENGTCTFSGTRDVAYGVNGAFFYRVNVPGSTPCNNATFGDPAVTIFKACYVSPPPISGTTFYNFPITFRPTDNLPINATLIVTTSAGTVTTTLTGVGALTVTVDSDKVTFPTTLIGGQSAREIYVTHTGPGPVEISGLATDDAHFTLTGDLGLPFDLAPNGASNWYKVGLGFLPTSSATLTTTGYITTNLGTLRVVMTGTGAIAQPYAISTASISATMFATQTSITRQFVVTNTGSQSIQINTTPYPSFDAGVAKGNVAFVHSISDTQAAAIVAVLTGTGLLQSVTPINLLTDLPTLERLLTYDAVLVGGVRGPDVTLLGNRVYEYLRQGRGLVLIGGALRFDECFLSAIAIYVASPCASPTSNITESLSVANTDFSHATLRNVSSFRRPAGSKYGISVDPAKATAFTDHSRVLVNSGPWGLLYGEDVYRVDLNFDPVFTECVTACGWDPATAGARLMANALRLSMGRQILRTGTSNTILPGKTATPTITLYGQVVSGTSYAELHVTVDGYFRQTLPVSLTVHGPPSLVQSGTTAAFNNVYVGKSQTVTVGLDDRGASPIDIYTVTISMPFVRMEQACGPFNVICDASTPTRLLPWSERVFSLIFQPTAPGTFTGTATFSTSVGIKTVSLSGTSAHDIEVRADPASVYITTTWNAIQDVPYTLTNLSVVTAWYTITKSSPNLTLSGALTSTLAAGEVRQRAFTATLSTSNVIPGAYISNVLVGQSDPFSASERAGDPYPISFYVVDRYLTVTPPSFVYPNAVLGVPLTRTFSLTNQGNVTLSVTGFGIDSADWTLVASLPITLAPAGRISVPLVFNPSALGALTATLVITSDAPQARSISLTATVVLTPQIAVQPAAIDETVLDDEQRPIAITITNSGQGNLDFTAAASGGTLFVLTGASGVVPAGQSARMTATIMGNLMAIGVQYHWPITITNNDPAAVKVVIPVTATDSGLPQPAGLVAPADGASNVSADVLFDWTRPTAATGARFRHWRADDAPPASAQFTGTNATTSYNPPGFLRESQRYLWQMETYNPYGATLGPVWSFTTEQRIDLQAMSLTAPDYAWSNGQIGVNWVISNAGHLTATGTWVDKIYLSTLPTFDGTATPLGQRNNVSALTPGQAYASSGTYTVPTGTEGLRYVHVKADANGAFVASREYTNNNTIAGTVMTVSLTPPPDLQVTSLSAPSDAFSQQTIQVNYIVSNTSAVTIPTTAWVDRIYLSVDDVLSVDDTLNKTVNQNRALGPGASYTGSAVITLPQGISGTHYVIVWTDALNAIFEHAGDNNNTRASNPINVILRPPPDLQVTSVVVPAATGSGQVYTVVYTVANLGPGDTDVSVWNDRIHRNQNPDHTVAPIVLATIGHTGILSAGQSYVVTRTFSMPDGITGNYYVHVAADHGSDVYEYTDEGNNWGMGGPISVTLTPPPDLQVTGVSAPAVGVAGSSSDVVFTVTNLGTGSTAAGAWIDRLYRNQNPDHSSPILLGSFNHAGVLAPGESYTVATTITWPAGVETTYYLHVQTDLNDDVYEHSNEGNNWGDSGPISVSLGLTPDLLAERIALLSAASVMRGRTISATWTVANIGEAAASGAWSDRIQLRRLSNSALYTLGTYARPAGLAIGVRYTRTLSIKVPSSVSADDYELRVVADIDNTIVENGREANNTAAATTTLSVLNALSGETDLMIDQADAAGAFGSGQPLTLTWRVTNELNTARPLWRDRVLLRDCSFACADVLLTEITQTGALAEGQGYAGSAIATLPNGISGTFTLVYQSDWMDQVNDIDPLNNTISMPITVTLSPWANLRPVDGPTAGPSFSAAWYRGFFRTITWSVENAGATPAAGAWTDRIYLSLNTVLDAGDPSLWTQIRNSGLAQGDAYTASANVAMPAVVTPGVYYLLVRTDLNDDVYERTDEGDNIRVGARITVDLPPPPDLIVMGVSHTAIGNNPGDALQASWTISNASVATATTTSLCDLAYVSADAIWDIGDALLGETCRAVSLPMGASARYTLTSVIPSLAPGEYRIIVRTDSRFGVAESDEGNNTGVAPITFTVDIPALTLGVTQTGELNNGAVLDFRVDAPGGAALEIKLDSAAGIGGNELYLRYGAPASRNAFDEIYPTPNSPDQRVLTPNTQAGTYFIRIYVNSGHSHTPYTLLARLVPFAVDSASPGQVGNAGVSTLDIRGSLFTTATQFALVGPGGATRLATSTLFVDAGQVYATFDLKGAPVGTWDVRASKGATTTVLVGGVTVITGTGGRLEASLQVPDSVRYHELGSSVRSYSTLYIQYSNVGDADLLAPVFWVQSPEGALLGMNSPSDVKAQTAHAIGLSTEGPVTTLRPGQSGSIPVLFSVRRPTSTFTFDMWYATSLDARPLDYADLEVKYRPAAVPNGQWSIIERDLRGLLGDTLGSYDQALAELAGAWAAQGRRETNARVLVSELVGIAFGQNGPTITGRVVISTGQPLISVTVATMGISPVSTNTQYAEAVTDNTGAFSLTHLMPGAYRLAIFDRHYYLTPTLVLTVELGVNPGPVTLTATALPAPEQTITQVTETEPQTVWINGVPHLIYASGGNILHTWQTGSGWHAPLKVGEGSRPRAVYDPSLLGAGVPGLAVFWIKGTGNSSHIVRNVGQPSGNTWVWSNPEAYFSGAVASTQPDVTVAQGGQPVVVWQMRDRVRNDDSDLYWKQGGFSLQMLAASDVIAIGTIGAFASIGNGAWVHPGEVAVMKADGSVLALKDASPADRKPDTGPSSEDQFRFERETKIIFGRELPEWLGKYQIEWKLLAIGKASQDGAGAEAGLQGAVQFSKYFGGSISANGVAQWALDKRTCRYVPDVLKIEVAAGLEIKTGTVPMINPLAEVASFGGQLYLGAIGSGEVKGIIGFHAASFPDMEGTLTLDLGAGPRGEVMWLYGMVQADLSGQWVARFTPKWREFPWGWNYDHWWFHGLAQTEFAFVHYKWEYKEGEDAPILRPGSTFVSGIAGGQVPGSSGSLSVTFSLTRPSGLTDTWDVNYLNPGTAGDVVEDGPPALVTDAQGRVQAFWSRSTENVDTTLGGYLMRSALSGTQWSAPEALSNTLGLNGLVRAARAQNGDIVVVWTRGDPSGLTITSDPTNVQQRFDAQDLWYARLVSGTQWTNPQILAASASPEAYPGLHVGAQGDLWASWQEIAVPNSQAKMLVAHWNGSGWDTPELADSGPLVGPAALAISGTAITLLTAHHVTEAVTAGQTFFSTALFQATRNAGVWGTSTRLTFDPPLTTTLRAEDTSAERDATPTPTSTPRPSSSPEAKTAPDDATPTPPPPTPRPTDTVEPTRTSTPTFTPTPNGTATPTTTPTPLGPPPTVVPVPPGQQGDSSENWIQRNLTLPISPPEPCVPDPNAGPPESRPIPTMPPSPPNVSSKTKPTGAHDPNDISGPIGVGDPKWVARDGSYSYVIRFENDPLLANAAAQRVVITAPLDANVNEDAFRLGNFGFGEHSFEVPANRSFYNARVGPFAIEVITGTTMMMMIDVVAGINVVNHQAFWIFQTIDPGTGTTPGNPLMGFLPPDYLDGNGQGFVNYSIRPMNTLTTGAALNAQAFIIFDNNDILPTNVATNTIDADRPWSSLAPMAASSAITRLLQWTASDSAGPGLSKQTGNPGSGLRDVSIYVSENGGAYGLWQTFGPTTTNAIFTGTPSTTYGFYTLASDNVGLVEAGKGASPETSTYIPVIKRAMLPVVRR